VGTLLGPGVYCTTTLEKALHYAKQHPQLGVIFELEVDLGRCKELNQGDPMMKTWQSHGYDSAWAPKGANSQGLEENCIKDPASIRIVNVCAGHTGNLRKMGIAVKSARLINTCNMPECKRETWNGRKGEQCCRTCKASNGTSHGPECEAKSNSSTAMIAPAAPSKRPNANTGGNITKLVLFLIMIPAMHFFSGTGNHK
jgi:hypothetical protein